MNSEFIRHVFSSWNQNGNSAFLGAAILFVVSMSFILRLILR